MKKQVNLRGLLAPLLLVLAVLTGVPSWSSGEQNAENSLDEPTLHKRQLWPQSIRNSQGTVLCLIPAGEFTMGFTNSQNGNEANSDYPAHIVRLSQPFYMARYELTVAEYRKFTSSVGYKTIAEVQGWSRGFIADRCTWGHVENLSWLDPGFHQEDTHPVVCINWFEAIAYVDWLNTQEQPTTPSGRKMKYVLPSEAQWEYACRGQTATSYSWGDLADDGLTRVNGRDAGGGPDNTIWSDTFSFRDGFTVTAPVGSFPPNSYGLCDMHGNVSEWCNDWYDPNYYRVAPRDDPQGPQEGSLRVDRGGGWYSSPYGCTSFYRGKLAPEQRSANLGLRIALVLDEPY
ncbi:MAG: formylglycine-generating enzyme family protein [Planctomycetia bacterium]|nr:formylglycine-generating enzyme family protein [Planctomycetia bacterium]